MAMLTRWAIAVMALVLVGVAHAQEAAFFRYEERAGLGNLTVRSIAQDARGMLWIGTENGLYRLDGFAIRREPLPDEAAAEIVEVKTDGIGHVWVAARNGVYAGLAAESGSTAAGRWHRIEKRDGTEDRSPQDDREETNHAREGSAPQENRQEAVDAGEERAT